MLRRILMMGSLAALVAGLATAAEMHKDMAAGEHDADMLMKEMMNCDVCKHMAPHLETLGPVMTMDIAQLNDGLAMMHGVSDPEKLAEYRAVSAEMDKAGEACLMLSDEDAKTHLCTMCQGIRSAVGAGAKMSMGPTKTGDIMVLTSDNPAVQKQLHKLGSMCEMMMSSM